MAFANRNDITILGTYIDCALSAKTDNRPEFQRMIKESGKKMFDVILVWKLDRFSRNRYDSAHYKDIDLQDANKEQIVLQMLSLFCNETYRVELIERCKACTLLSYRCQQIYNLVVDENNMISHIKSHHQTIEWHLDRLYRIRNEIAHSALYQHVAIVRYTEHLYDYLATYISEIVRFACKKDITSFGTLSAAINDNYQEFELITSDKKFKDKKALLGNLWASGIMNFI